MREKLRDFLFMRMKVEVQAPVVFANRRTDIDRAHFGRSS